MIFDEVSKYNPRRFTLDFSSFLDSIVAEINREEKKPRRKKVVSKTEEYINGAIKVNRLNLFKGEIITPKKDYIYGYQDLIFEEFCSYIYWRTQIRKRKTVFVPGGFLALYLIEIVNFVEFNTISECLETMIFLETLSVDVKSNMRQIKKAKEELLFYYGTLTATEKIVNYSEYEYLLEDDRIICKNHPALLKCLCQRHYSAFLKSKMYLQHADVLEKDFYEWFYSVCNYFAEREIDILDLYYGYTTYSKMRNVYIKEIVKERIITKEVILNNTPIIKVSDDVELITKHFTDGTLRNKEHIYIRSVVVKYLLRLYECKKRKELKFPKTYPSVTELHNGFCDLEMAEHLENIFESEEFNQFYIY